MYIPRKELVFVGLIVGILQMGAFHYSIEGSLYPTIQSLVYLFIPFLTCALGGAAQGSNKLFRRMYVTGMITACGSLFLLFPLLMALGIDVRIYPPLAVIVAVLASYAASINSGKAWVSLFIATFAVIAYVASFREAWFWDVPSVGERLTELERTQWWEVAGIFLLVFIFTGACLTIGTWLLGAQHKGYRRSRSRSGRKR